MKKILLFIVCMLLTLTCFSCDKKNENNDVNNSAPIIKGDEVSKEEWKQLFSADYENVTVISTETSIEYVLDLIKGMNETDVRGPLYDELISNHRIAFEMVNTYYYTKDKFYRTKSEEYLNSSFDTKKNSYLYFEMEEPLLQSNIVAMNMKPYEKVEWDAENLTFVTSIVDEWTEISGMYDTFKDYLGIITEWKYDEFEYNNEDGYYERIESNDESKIVTKILIMYGKPISVVYERYYPLEKFKFNDVDSCNPLSIDQETGFGLSVKMQYEFKDFGKTTIETPKDFKVK